MRVSRVAYLPLDDRPCNTTFPSLLAQIAGIDLLAAPSAGKFQPQSSDAAIVSVDRFVFGGLVESRSPRMSFAGAQLKMAKLRDLLGDGRKMVYGHGVLMRQAPSMLTEKEEKIGALIKRASMSFADKKKLNRLLSGLPSGAWKNYLAARKRNLWINRESIRWVKRNFIQFLAVTLDDLSSKGINRLECAKLESAIRQSGLRKKIHLLPGTDEAGMLLLARLILFWKGKAPRLFPVYSHPTPERFKLRYEDRPITKIFNQQAALLGCRVVKALDDADILVFVHSPHEHQLDLDAADHPVSTSEFLGRLNQGLAQGWKCVLADARFANGADRTFMREAAQEISLSRLSGYSAWNTAANALGMALSHGVVHWISSQAGMESRQEEAHARLLLLRLMEDWVYQGEIRPALLEDLRHRGESVLHLSPSLLEENRHKVSDQMTRLSQLHFASDLPLIRRVEVDFPWKRPFDISIHFDYVASMGHVTGGET